MSTLDLFYLIATNGFYMVYSYTSAISINLELPKQYIGGKNSKTFMMVKNTHKG